MAGNSYGGIWAYLATPTAAANESTVTLLTAGAYTVAATHTSATGEETLALTMDNWPVLLHSLAFNYGVINWVTKGVFLGSRRIYFSPQIDDMLIGDRLYAPTLPQCPQDSSCPVVRTTAEDLQALENWQSGIQLNSLFQNSRATIAYNGIGTTSDYSPPNDPLIPAIMGVGSRAGWVSHTWSHGNLDCYTVTNGVCAPATVTQSLAELDQNIALAATLGITIDSTGLVTPFNSGLSNQNFLQAAAQRGITSIVYPGDAASPNTGIVNPLAPSILEMPRPYTNLYDDVSSPLTGAYGSWPDEYNSQFGPKGANPAFSQNQTYSQILGNESENVLLTNVLTYAPYPIGFHICDMSTYDGTNSLYTDLLGTMIAKYSQMFTLPVVTLDMRDIEPLLVNRASYNASGVTGVYTPGVNVVLTAVGPGTVPVTGACSQATCASYGGQMQDSVSMAANSSVTLSLFAGQATILTAVAMNPAIVVGGNSSTGTVTLSGPAPADGISIALSSNNPSATVPATVTVAAGSSATTFTVTTIAVASSATATITASYNSVNKTSLLTITPVIALSAVSLNPTTVTGGNSSTGTVTLNAAAPTGGIPVALSSNNSSAVVPASVTVSAASSTATFTLTTTAVASSATATITASYNSLNKTAAINITPVIALSAVSLNPTTITGGNSSTGTVILSAPAPAGGIAVALSSNNSSAVVPASVTVSGGSSTATFTVTTKTVTSSTAATITANYSGLNRTAILTMTPAISLSSVSQNPATVTGGTSSTGTATLNAPAPTGGILVALSSNNPSATVPASVTVAAGSSVTTFTVTTIPVASLVTATITANYNSVNKTATLTITPPVGLSSLSLNPTAVAGGNLSTGIVTLSGTAPTGGVSVALSSNSSSATVPASVSVPGGKVTVKFTVTTTVVASSTIATITVSYNGVNKTAALTIAPAVSLSSLSLNPATVPGGSPSTGTVLLSGPAPPGGVRVTLKSDQINIANVPSSITIASGSASGSFRVSTSRFRGGKAQITATCSGASKSASLTVQ